MRPNRLIAALLLTAAVLAAAPEKAAAPGNVYRLQWRDLGRLAQGWQISFTLPSGIRLKGDFVSADADELVLDIRKTSDKRAYPKGRATVPRQEITSCSILQKKGLAWRAAGTAIGGAVGTVVAIPVVAFSTSSEARTALAVGAAVGIPAGLGYLLGWSADRRVLQVEIVPQPDSAH